MQATTATLRAGGMALDDAIRTYVRKKYGLIIGQMTAEQVKTAIHKTITANEKPFKEMIESFSKK